MSRIDVLKKFDKKKILNKKIAEIIWISLGAVVLAFGIFSLVTNLIVMNIGTDTTNLFRDIGYPLVEFQSAFVKWWNKWSVWKISSFFNVGIVFTLVSTLYLIIVIYIYSIKQDQLQRKIKAKQLREKNTQKFLEDQKAFEEKLANQKVAQEELKTN